MNFFSLLDIKSYSKLKSAVELNDCIGNIIIHEGNQNN